MGFILVRLDFSDLRITVENIHVMVGISIFYLTLFRLIYKFFSKSPKLIPEAFIGPVSYTHLTLPTNREV